MGRVALIISLLFVTGCDRLLNKAEDDRRLQMDCEMVHTDGTVMRCRQDLEKSLDTEDDSISIKHPAGGG